MVSSRRRRDLGVGGDLKHHRGSSLPFDMTPFLHAVVVTGTGCAIRAPLRDREANPKQLLGVPTAPVARFGYEALATLL